VSEVSEKEKGEGEEQRRIRKKFDTVRCFARSEFLLGPTTTALLQDPVSYSSTMLVSRVSRMLVMVTGRKTSKERCTNTKDRNSG
jgi:hypothetical protein